MMGLVRQSILRGVAVLNRRVQVGVLNSGSMLVERKEGKRRSRPAPLVNLRLPKVLHTLTRMQASQCKDKYTPNAILEVINPILKRKKFWLERTTHQLTKSVDNCSFLLCTGFSRRKSEVNLNVKI